MRNALIVLVAVALVIVALGAFNNDLLFDIDLVVATWTAVSLFWVAVAIAGVVVITGFAAAFFARSSAVATTRKLEKELQGTYERLRDAEAKLPVPAPAQTAVAEATPGEHTAVTSVVAASAADETSTIAEAMPEPSVTARRRSRASSTPPRRRRPRPSSLRRRRPRTSRTRRRPPRPEPAGRTLIRRRAAVHSRGEAPVIDPGSWSIAPVDFADVHRLAAELGVNEVMAQVLVRRGFSDAAAAQAFLHPDFLVHNPYLMAGMADARRRLDKALQRGEPIAVHGDYDADGITATFVLVSVLEQLGADARWHLPNRFSEGYGVSAAAVEELAAAGVKLLVTVDCGINSRAEVARAGELGMDVIVTDHHEVEGQLPDCVVVTPKLPGYPCPQLAGVGVAFKLAHALLEEPAEARVEVPLALRPLSDVVAIGTIADIVPLVDENRILASIGLGRLRSAPRPGLAALMEVAGVKADGVNAGTVGFRLAPRLNAAGRLEDASLALELLGCADRDAALPMALRLNELNQERQAIEAGILSAAVEMVPDPPPPALVLSSPAWHEGVVGIVASRVAERFNRPAILLSEGDEEAKGSGRSIPGFDLLGAVEGSAEHLLAFGGHRAACGLRLRREHISAFRKSFVAQAAAMLGAADLVRTQPVDAVVGGHDLTLGLADELELLAPHGFGNRKVTLLLHGAEVVGPRLTRDHRHAQYRGTLRRSHVPGDPLQLRQAAGTHRTRPLRRAAELVEERVQRRRERPGRGQRAAPARCPGP